MIEVAIVMKEVIIVIERVGSSIRIAPEEEEER